MLSQVPAFHSVPAELWAAIAAGLGLLTWSAKRLFARNRTAKPEYIDSPQLHAELDALAARLAAAYLALADKLEASHRELLAALDRQAAAIERRLDQVETALARVDERTKLHMTEHSSFDNPHIPVSR
jgi:hypothetical protein